MKNAGKACNNRLYRHIRTFEKIIKNYFVIYYKTILFLYESQLFRAYGTPTVADRIRNPGYRPTYSYGLARPIPKNSLMQAWLILGCRPGLS